MNKQKICVVATVSGFLKSFMLEDLRALSQHYHITIIATDIDDYQTVFAEFSVVKQINIVRKVSPFQDLKTLFLLLSYFKKNQFDVVLSVTPKASLLAILTAFLLRVPRRVQFFTGQVWANKTGLKLFLLRNVDKFIANIATHILVAGKGQRDFLITQKIISNQKSTVMFHGVNVARFSLDTTLKSKLREKYKLQNDSVIFMFLGRINPDKGVVELIAVASDLLEQYNQLVFFLIGDNEGGIDCGLWQAFQKLDRVFILTQTNHPERILNIADVLVLPSHREGCAQTPFEAAAMKIPTIASDIYGLADSVIDQQTGLIHRVQDTDDMRQKYQQLITDTRLRQQLANNAYYRAINEFDKKKMSSKFVNFFKEL